jgi:predicted membrane-bound mannosyltransferase
MVYSDFDAKLREVAGRAYIVLPWASRVSPTMMTWTRPIRNDILTVNITILLVQLLELAGNTIPLIVQVKLATLTVNQSIKLNDS